MIFVEDRLCRWRNTAHGDSVQPGVAVRYYFQANGPADRDLDLEDRREDAQPIVMVRDLSGWNTA